MSTYQFANLPSTSSVATAVTFLVSGWLLVAAGAIASEAQGERNVAQQAAAPQVVAAPASAPEARFTIVVEARRTVARG